MELVSRSILYIGSNCPATTARHRADALRRLGCHVTVVNPEELIGQRHRWQSFLDYRTGYRFLQRRLLRALKVSISCCECSPDLIWVNGGELLGPDILKWLQQKLDCKIILYQNDDPTGYRDGNRFLSLQAGLRFYNLCVFVRPETALEALAMGARKVLRVLMSYDEVHHSPAHHTHHEAPHPLVSFIGTLIPGEPRDHFLAGLMKAGVPLRVIGNLWRRSSLWPLIQSIYQGPSRSETAYSRALGDAAVSLGLLSHQNRDLVTRRSFETPACGGLLCAERTSEHQLLYEDSQEAVFWDSVDECVLQCKRILADPELRREICTNGSRRVREIGVRNEDICRQILASV